MKAIGLLAIGAALGLLVAGLAGQKLFEKFHVRLDRWEHPRAAARWSGDEQGPIVAFMGASITADWNLEEYFPELHLLNAGLGYDFAGHELLRFRRDVLRHAPRVIVIKPCAINLVRSGYGRLDPVDPGIARDALAMMVDLCRAQGATPVLCTPVPIGESWLTEQDDPELRGRFEALTQWVRDYCEEEAVLLVDYQRSLADEFGLLPAALGHDGLHVNDEGYALMAASLRPVLDEALSKTEGETE